MTKKSPRRPDASSPGSWLARFSINSMCPHALPFWKPLLTASLLFATCSGFAQSLPEIYQADPQDQNSFADVNLKIDRLDCPDWSTCKVHASGLYKGVKTGLEVHIARHNGRNLGIVYRSTGKESDSLLAALADIYKVPQKKTHFKKSVYGEVVVLRADDKKMSNKIFFSVDGPESDYAELYTNIDREKGVLQIREKDVDYRDNVLKALTE